MHGLAQTPVQHLRRRATLCQSAGAQCFNGSLTLVIMCLIRARNGVYGRGKNHGVITVRLYCVYVLSVLKSTVEYPCNFLWNNSWTLVRTENVLCCLCYHIVGLVVVCPNSGGWGDCEHTGRWLDVGSKGL